MFWPQFDNLKTFSDPPLNRLIIVIIPTPPLPLLPYNFRPELFAYTYPKHVIIFACYVSTHFVRSLDTRKPSFIDPSEIRQKKKNNLQSWRHAITHIEFNTGTSQAETQHNAML